jgi:DNA-binding LytR/AlgR family response regulator
MPTLRCVLIEDEPLAASRLEKMLQKTSHGIQVIAILESVRQALEWFPAHPAPDLIFSDIQLGDGISFQIFDRIEPPCPVIFTTSYDEYALRAFKIQSIDYLLKPIKPEELELALGKFQKQRATAPAAWTQFQEQISALMAQVDPGQRSTRYRERFLVRQADQLIPISVAEIAYFFTKNDWVCLSTTEGRQHLVDFRLDELEAMLDPALFFRLNRQFLASATALVKAHHHLNGKLKLDLRPQPEEEVFVSREKAALFRTWWESAEG